MIAIWNETCTDDFTPDDPNGVTIGKNASIYEWGSLVISGGPVACRFWHGRSGGTGTPLEMPLLLPGTYPVASRPGKDWVLGLDFKNATPGQTPPAVVTCVLYEPERAGLAPTAVVNPLASATDEPVGFYTAVPSAGNPVPSGTQSTWLAITFAGAGAGTDLLNVDNGIPFSSWVPKEAGMYSYMGRIGMDPSPLALFPAGHTMQLNLSPLGADRPPADNWSTQATSLYPINNSSFFMADINTIQIPPRFLTPDDQNFGMQFGLQVFWDYVGDVNISGFVEVLRIS